MDFQFDRKGILFAMKLVTLAGVILVTGSIATHDVANLVFEQSVSDQYVPLPTRPDKPAYQQVPQDALIYSSNAEVIKKQEELLQEKKDFAFANLTDLTLRVYKDGWPY